MRRVKLADAFILQMGKTPSRDEPQYWDGDFAWVAISDMGKGKYICKTKETISQKGIKESGIKIVPKNTVVMSFKLSIGKTAITSDDMYTNEAIMALIDKKIYNINVDYLYHALSSVDWDKNGNRAVMGVTLNKATLSNIEIPLPEIDEQCHIAKVLDKLDSIIETRKNQLTKLAQLVKARFVEMFVLSSDTINWDIVTVQSIAQDLRTGPFGSALLHEEFVDSGIFVLGIDNAVENKFSYNKMRYITNEKYQQLKRYTVNPLDVIITIMGTVGRTAVIPKDIPTAINTKHLACITLNHKQANPYFFSLAFQIHPYIQGQLHKQSKGAIMDGLNLTIIKRINFPLPPLFLQEEFAAFVQKVDKTKEVVKQSLEKLETLKNSLMQEYFG